LYPTATLDTARYYFEANADVIENVRSAKLLTVPSQWVADIFRRDMLLNPVVLPHGVDVEDWVPNDNHSNYVLWAKGHQPGVCDPDVLNMVAGKMPNMQFVATFGQRAANVSVVGRVPFSRMKKMLAGAGVLLAPTKETFGIQTLEAMALAVPVIGYDWGGTADIISHQYDGWLAEPGDVDGLVEGIRWALKHRDVVGLRARQTVKERFGWSSVCERLARIYRQVLNDHHRGPKVSVIIPCYNYGYCVDRAIESVLDQQFDGEFEVIVVDDGSNDNSAEVIERYKDRVTIISTKNSGSPAHSRNCGIRYAAGEYIACLDADDEAVPGALALLASTLDNDRGLGIAYGGLEIVYRGGEIRRKSAWPPDFCFKRQVVGQNQIPSFCMFRREAWRRVGGYNAAYTPAEDAELWTRITSVGYDAEKATDAVTYIYAAHEDSLSRVMREPNYVDGKPWSRNPDLTPFAAPACDYRLPSHPVRNYDDPWVSVIIPVGPGHAGLAWHAVESVWLQSVPYVECIVVNDSGEELHQPTTMQPLEDAYPYVKLVVSDARNVSVARNVGAVVARADFLIFLDADDWLESTYVAEVIEAYNDNPDCYVYTDWLSYNGRTKKHQTRSFDCERLKAEAIHAVTALVPKAWHDAVGGFDEELGREGWEDWDYYLKLVLNENHPGFRVKEPLMTYSSVSGARRDTSYANKDKLLPIILQRYGDKMCKCRSRKIGDKPSIAKRFVEDARSDVKKLVASPHGRHGVALPSKSRNRVKEDKAAMVDTGMVMVIESSGNMGGHHVIGAATRKRYGRFRHGDTFSIDIRDQRAQPQLYVLVDRNVTRHVYAPERPVPPVVSRPTPVVEAPVPVSLETRVVEKVPKEGIEPSVESYSVDADGVDISLLSLRQIKGLDLDPEFAAAAYEEEVMGHARKTVMSYLEDLAGDWLEEEDE